jgi:hypothetical protein
MAVGMVISAPLALLGGALFGAMEVMLPVMTTGMVAGMVVSMSGTMAAMSFADGAWLGSLSGVAVLVATYIANTIIKGRASRWTS